MTGAERARPIEQIVATSMRARLSISEAYPEGAGGADQAAVGLHRLELHKAAGDLFSRKGAAHHADLHRVDADVADNRVHLGENHLGRYRVNGVHAEDGTTIVITSHNMADIERLCSRVAFMARGRIVADDTPGEIVARFGAQNLEETFLSVAAGQTGEAAKPEGVPA